MYSSGPWFSSRPDIRASDAERERVAAFLRDQAAEGRLTPDELDERVGRAYSAKTIRELQALIADLPRAPLTAPRRYAARPPRRNVPALLPLGILAFLALGGPGLAWGLAILASALTVGALVAVVAVSAVLGPFLLVAALIILALRRRRPHRWEWDPRWR